MAETLWVYWGVSSMEESCKKKNPYEKELDRYRENCKNQAFTLFAKWFFYLWG